MFIGLGINMAKTRRQHIMDNGYILWSPRLGLDTDKGTCRKVTLQEGNAVGEEREGQLLGIDIGLFKNIISDKPFIETRWCTDLIWFQLSSRAPLSMTRKCTLVRPGQDTFHTGFILINKIVIRHQVSFNKTFNQNSVAIEQQYKLMQVRKLFSK